MKFNQNMHFFAFDPIYPRVGSIPAPAVNLSDEKPQKEETIYYPIEGGVTYNEDGTATLRYFNPKAKEVSLRYRLHNYLKSQPEFRQDPDFYAKKDYTIEPMTKVEGGYWEITIDPGKGYHSVYFVVDGQTVINTVGAYIYDSDGIRNFIDIPDDPDTAINDVPHGAITREIYKSTVTNRYRACWVYTPASYQANPEKRYPVVYIQHGGGQDETSWFQGGKIDLILDNLIARGDAEEMIVVANSGACIIEAEEGKFYTGKIEDVIVNDCVPFIDGRYRTIADRTHRAICGLSMGGGHTRRIGFNHPDYFANVGIFSSGECFPTVTSDSDWTELFTDVEKFNSLFDYVVVACGDADLRYDKTYADVTPYIEKGLNIEFKGYKGQHEWNVWRYCAKDFVQKIFKK